MLGVGPDILNLTNKIFAADDSKGSGGKESGGKEGDKGGGGGMGEGGVVPVKVVEQPVNVRVVEQPVKVEVTNIPRLQNNRLDVIGIKSLNNLTIGASDYKTTYDDLKKIEDYQPFVNYADIQEYYNYYPDKTRVVDNPYLNWLIEHNVLHRDDGFSFSGSKDKTYLKSTIDQNKYKDSNRNFLTSELVMALVKNYEGVQPSRYVMAYAKPQRTDENGNNYNVGDISVEKYPLLQEVGKTGVDWANADTRISYTNFGDYYIYMNPNVYELYLTKALEKGIVTPNSLKVNHQFLRDYYFSHKGTFSGKGSLLDFYSRWENNLDPLTPTGYSSSESGPDDFRRPNAPNMTLGKESDNSLNNRKNLWYVKGSKYFGESFAYGVSLDENFNGKTDPYNPLSEKPIIQYKNLGEYEKEVDSFMALSKSSGDVKQTLFSRYVNDNTTRFSWYLSAKQETPEYFSNEVIKYVDALRYIYNAMQTYEKNMTATEAKQVSFKYGAKLNHIQNDSDLKVVQYLIAKGVINFENPAEYNNLYREFKVKDALPLLYRLNNKNARTTFEILTLTAEQEDMMNKGFMQDKVEVTDVSVPVPPSVSEAEVKASREVKANDLVTYAFKVAGSGGEVGSIGAETKIGLSSTPTGSISGKENEDYFMRAVYTPDSTWIVLSLTQSYYNRIKSSSSTGKLYVQFAGYNVAADKKAVDIPTGYRLTKDGVMLTEFPYELQKDVWKIEDEWKGEHPNEVNSDLPKDNEDLPVEVPIVEEGNSNDGQLDNKDFHKNENSNKNDGLTGRVKNITFNYATDTSKSALKEYVGFQQIKASEVDKVFYKGVPITQAKPDGLLTKVEKLSNGYGIYYKTTASDFNTMNAVFQSNLKYTGDPNVSFSSYTKSLNGKQFTLIPQKEIQTLDKSIDVIKDKLLRNNQTGAYALLSPEDGIAFIGNEIKRYPPDTLMVTSINGEKFYNLEVVAGIMSNSALGMIDPNNIYRSKSNSSVVIPIINSAMQQVGKTYMNKTPSVTSVNLTHMSNNVGTLIYDTSTMTGVNKSKIVLDWQWMLPPADSGHKSALPNKTLTEKEMSEFLYTPPSGSNKEWWDLNKGISNGFLNGIFETNNIDYNISGYLVPRITILAPAGQEGKVFETFLAKGRYDNEFVQKFKLNGQNLITQLKHILNAHKEAKFSQNNTNVLNALRPQVIVKKGTASGGDIIYDSSVTQMANGNLYVIANSNFTPKIQGLNGSGNKISVIVNDYSNNKGTDQILSNKIGTSAKFAGMDVTSLVSLDINNNTYVIFEGIKPVKIRASSKTLQTKLNDYYKNLYKSYDKSQYLLRNKISDMVGTGAYANIINKNPEYHLTPYDNVNEALRYGSPIKGKGTLWSVNSYSYPRKEATKEEDIWFVPRFALAANSFVRLPDGKIEARNVDPRFNQVNLPNDTITANLLASVLDEFFEVKPMRELKGGEVVFMGGSHWTVTDQTAGKTILNSDAIFGPKIYNSLTTNGKIDSKKSEAFLASVIGKTMVYNQGNPVSLLTYMLPGGGIGSHKSRKPPDVVFEPKILSNHDGSYYINNTLQKQKVSEFNGAVFKSIMEDKTLVRKLMDSKETIWLIHTDNRTGGSGYLNGIKFLSGLTNLDLEPGDDMTLTLTNPEDLFVPNLQEAIAKLLKAYEDKRNLAKQNILTTLLLDFIYLLVAFWWFLFGILKLGILKELFHRIRDQIGVDLIKKVTFGQMTLDTEMSLFHLSIGSIILIMLHGVILTYLV